MLSCIIALTACGSNDEPQPTFTQVNTLLADSDNPCKNSLITVANDLIKQKEHFLQLESFDQKQQTTADNVQNLLLSGVILYKDRPSHVRFASVLHDQSCRVNYQLDYHFNNSCLEIREQSFKKWLEVGRLGTTTRYYGYKYDPNKTAYLTDLDRNRQCLVSVKKTHVIPLAK